MDELGYEKYLKEIDDIKFKLHMHQANQSESYNASIGDGWHDNFAFEEQVREENRLRGLLQRKLLLLNKIKIIEPTDKEDVVGIGDTISLTIIYDDAVEKDNFILISNANSINNQNENFVSLNSLLGKAIYGKKVGEKIKCEHFDVIIEKVNKRRVK